MTLLTLMLLLYLHKMKLLTQKKILMGKLIKKRLQLALWDPNFLVTPGNPSRDALLSERRPIMKMDKYGVPLLPDTARCYNFGHCCERLNSKQYHFGPLNSKVKLIPGLCGMSSFEFQVISFIFEEKGKNMKQIWLCKIW